MAALLEEEAAEVIAPKDTDDVERTAGGMGGSRFRVGIDFPG